jgi:shikimate kinase
MRIFLIGFMGSGKSSIGKELAYKLGLFFIDLDSLIEEKTSNTVAEIFSKQGEEKFRKIEHQCLKETFKADNVVIATGGGAPCFHNNMQLINEHGISVYIKLNAGMLASRLMSDNGKRPLLKDHTTPEDFRKHISQLLETREPYYEKATFIIEGKNISAKKIIEKLSGSI